MAAARCLRGLRAEGRRRDGRPRSYCRRCCCNGLLLTIVIIMKQCWSLRQAQAVQRYAGCFFTTTLKLRRCLQQAVLPALALAMQATMATASQCSAAVLVGKEAALAQLLALRLERQWARRTW